MTAVRLTITPVAETGVAGEVATLPAMSVINPPLRFSDVMRIPTSL